MGATSTVPYTEIILGSLDLTDGDIAQLTDSAYIDVIVGTVHRPFALPVQGWTIVSNADLVARWDGSCLRVYTKCRVLVKRLEAVLLPKLDKGAALSWTRAFS